MATKDTEPKLTAGEKRAQKRRETAAKMETIFGTGKGSTEPTLNPLDYTASMMCALNYYNSAFENKDKRKWFMSYVGKKSTEFDSLSDWDFRSVGTVIRLKQREQPLIDKDLQFIEDTIAELRTKATGVQKFSALKGAPKVKEEKSATSIQDKMISAASEHAGEINGLIDDFVKLDTDFDVASYLKANEVNAQVAKHIPQHFGKTIAELQEYIKGEDKQLIEGYSNLGKVKAKKLIKTLEAIEDACKQQAVTAKAARKPTVRKIKVKPPAVIAKAVKFMREYVELKLKSVLPENIVGASECWIYNTKYKKLQVYRSLAALSIKGTTILNYDVATSGSKTIRKPELISSYVSLTKRNIGLEFKNLKTKEAAVNGRINEDCIILKVFG